MKESKATSPQTNVRNSHTKAGAPRPRPSSSLWNEWAANNPQPQAIALGKVNVRYHLMGTMKAIAIGARPIEL
jgi:hypothetical protein